MTSPQRNATRIAGLLFALSALACTADDPVVNDIGTVTLFPADPSIVAQSVTVLPPGGSVDGNRMQAVFLQITQAMLELPGRPPYDLLFSATPECLLADTPLSTPVSLGTCTDFLVLESFPDTAGIRATLTLTLEVELKRVNPVVLFVGGDEDLDGVGNGIDNCPLVPNPDQQDTGGLGLGNACRVQDAVAGSLPDSDGDGIIDFFDNCAHIANPAQANPPTGKFWQLESIVSDGIGWDCEPPPKGLNTTGFAEQVIQLSPQTTTITFDFVLPQSQAFVVIDLDDDRVFDCDWSMGTCSAGWADNIQACVRAGSAAAVQGCN